MSNTESIQYKVPNVEKGLNAVINFVFYYRLILVIASIIILAFVSRKVYFSSPSADKYKNIALVFTCGSIVIGIFYSILNYEHAQIKYKKDINSARLTLSFNAACEWHRPTMVESLKIAKQLYDEHKHLIDDNRSVEFSEILEKNEIARSALVSILNYMECISLGVAHSILDDNFINGYFSTVFKMYNSNYGFYINHKRAVANSAKIWVNYTNLVQNWHAKELS